MAEQRRHSIKERDVQRVALLAKQNEAFAGAKEQGERLARSPPMVLYSEPRIFTNSHCECGLVGYTADRDTFDEFVAYKSSISQLNIAEASEGSPILLFLVQSRDAC